jgi:hypothetical protein
MSRAKLSAADMIVGPVTGIICGGKKSTTRGFQSQGLGTLRFLKSWVGVFASETHTRGEDGTIH